jgi:ABC-type lipoprotein release transport system permease subunit
MALVPLAYNLRSLRARWSSTLLTALSIAATVAVLGGMLCLQQGFATLFVERGRNDLVVLLRPGASAEGESFFPLEQVDQLVKGNPEFALDTDGQPLASGELFLAVRRPKQDGGEVNVPVRGVQAKSFAIHGDDIAIVQGRKFAPGADEVVVGHALVERIRDCRLGDVLTFNTTPFRVVGVMRGKGAQGSEVWGDAERLMAALQRSVLSRVIGKVKPGTDVDAMSVRLASDKQVAAKVETETAYLARQTTGLSGTLAAIAIVLCLIMGVGAIFTGVNAMFAAIASRTHEIGVLRSIGFRPGAIFLSFLVEALLLGLLGGVLGCLFILPLHGIQTGTMNFATFSEIAFGLRITPLVLGVSVAVAVLLGLLGGTIPAWRAARLRPTQALRRV